MDRRSFLKRGSGITLGTILQGCGLDASFTDKCPAEKTTANNEPNLLFIFPDQHRRQSMGFLNADRVNTPNLDRFAQESMVFENAISCFPLCSPYRGITFSGQYPLTNGVTFNGGVFKPGVTTIFDVLQKAGYRTGYVGKWHLSGLYKQEHVVGDRRYRKWRYSEKYKQNYWMREWTPRKYRPYFDYWHANECFNDLFRLNYFEEDPDDPVLGRQWQPEHETDVAIDYMRKCKADSKPFALFLAWNPPHFGFETQKKDIPNLKPEKLRGGYIAPPEYEAKYSHLESTGRPNFEATLNRNNENIIHHIPGYFGSVESIDDCFGRLMKFLKDEGLDENTIVVFTSDHGEMMGSHGLLSKRVWYEESLGVPFMIRWPGRIKPKNEAMVLSNLNIMPTLLGLLELPIPEAVEGEDYSDVLRGKAVQAPEYSLIGYMCTFGRKTPQSLDYITTHPHNGKLPECGGNLWIGEWRGVRTPRHTYAVQMFRGKTTRYLYNLKEDPYQLNPIKTTDKPIKEMLVFEAKLCEFLEETNDPFLKWMNGKEQSPECLLAEGVPYPPGRER